MNDQYSDRKSAPVTQAEQLSALFDGELSGDPVRFLMRSVDSDASLAQRWSRYQIASMVIQRKFVYSQSGEAFVAGVMARLDAAPVQLRASQRGGARVLRWAGGGAIAAAVAVVALVASRPVGEGASPMGVSTLASAPGSAMNTSAGLPLELRALAAPQAPLPAGIADYTQPASYESYVPAYSLPTLRGQATQNSGDTFVPYVLLVGSRKPLPPQPSQPQAATRN